MSLNEMRLANILFESEDKYAHLVNEVILNEAVEDVQGYIETLEMLKNGLVGHDKLKKVIEELQDQLNDLADESAGRLSSLYGGGAKAKKAKTATENLKAQIWDLYKKLALSSRFKNEFEASKRKLASKQIAIKVQFDAISPAATPPAPAPSPSGPTSAQIASINAVLQSVGIADPALTMLLNAIIMSLGGAPPASSASPSPPAGPGPVPESKKYNLSYLLFESIDGDLRKIKIIITKAIKSITDEKVRIELNNKKNEIVIALNRNENVKKMFVGSKPTSEPAAEPVVEPAAEPVVEPAAEPVVEPAAEPVVEPAAEPVVEPVDAQGKEDSTLPLSVNRETMDSLEDDSTTSFDSDSEVNKSTQNDLDAPDPGVAVSENSDIRKAIIKEIYSLNLQNLFEATIPTNAKKSYINFDRIPNDLESDVVGLDLMISHQPSDEDQETVDFGYLNLPGITELDIPKDIDEFYIVGIDASNNPAPLPDRFSSDAPSRIPDKTLDQLDSGLSKTGSAIDKSQSKINDLVAKKANLTELSTDDLKDDFKTLKMLQFTSNYKLIEKMITTPVSSLASLSGPAAAATGAAAIGAAGTGLAGGGGSAGAGGAGGSAGGRGAPRHSLKNALSGIGIDDAKIEVIKDRINPLVGYIFNESVSYDQNRLEVLAGIRKK